MSTTLERDWQEPQGVMYKLRGEVLEGEMDR